MTELTSQDTLLRWLQDIVCVTETTTEALPTWVLRAYQAAQGGGTINESDITYEEETNGTPITETSAPSQTTDDELFNFELVYIKVESTVFSVIKEWLMEEGCTFSDMFSLPINDAERMAPASVEGKTKRNPIILEGVSVASFQSFLRVMYGSRGKSLVTYDEWVGALELSTRWNFTQTRNTAIARLEPFLTTKGPAARIRLARQFHVKNWLRDGLTDLATQVMSSVHDSPSTLSGGDMALDMATIANIFFICFNMKKSTTQPAQLCGCRYETRLSTPSDYCKYCGTLWVDQSPNRDAFEQQVDIAFAQEIAAFQIYD
ncbi:hypothetical protein D9619_011167 [Psilocybe cf. subviscida]|uniref:BTB domain-containing protein n=1 Tax=Psilocybe cf. subviscida TaxID=2480587 RepID=A0A8H5F5P2_9AGAR|nr:hypothetical protein D9619_011167 [Psilocybe cf. subviscida]